VDLTLLRAKIRPVLRTYQVTVCYLFGSRATGNVYEDSDVDLGLLFHPFNQARHNLDLELQVESELAKALSPLPVDAVFLQRAELAFRFEVISSGVVLYSENEEFRTDFEEATVRDYQDFAPVLRAYYRDLKEELTPGKGPNDQA